MRKSDVVRILFEQNIPTLPVRPKGVAFAPTNIALCKYWGKRAVELNLPVTSILSVSLPDKGALTQIELHDLPYDHITLNGKEIPKHSDFAKRIHHFLDLFRQEVEWHANIEINMDIPVAAGLASSACGFAALVLALKNLFDWKLNMQAMSILARLGSGSASRSLWSGFVEWHAGTKADGMDSYSKPLPFHWPEIYIGILPLSQKEKAISSRKAMQRTVSTSTLYRSWPQKVMHDIVVIRQALHTKNFPLLASTAESNALTMHGTMLGCWPPLCYFLPETVAAMHQIWQLRAEGLEVYFTEDAGPNLKLLFLHKNMAEIQAQFPTLEVIKLFV